MTAFRKTGWRPRWAFTDEPYGFVVFTTESDQSTKAVQPHEGQLVAGFLKHRLETAAETDLSSEASFLYVLLGRALEPDDDPTELQPDGVLVEFGFGEAPAAPASWDSTSLRELIVRAINWLAEKDP